MSELVKQLNFKRFYFSGTSFEQQAIKDGTDHLVHYLHKHIRSGSPFILFTACNHIKTAIVYYAILKAGKIAVLLDPAAKPAEVADIVGELEPAAIISVNTARLTFDYPSEIVFRPQPRQFNICSGLEDVCTIVYTNAEDGYPKGAMITEKNLLSEIYPMIRTNKLTPGSVTCALLPFSHLYGLVHGILLPALAGCTGLITEMNLLRVQDMVAEMTLHQVTHVYTIPPVYYIMGKVPGIGQLCRWVQEFYTGGAGLSPKMYECFYQKTGRTIREGYGLTETTSCAAYQYQEASPVPGSFGLPMPGCRIKIAGTQGTECLPGQTGEIYIQGDIVFKGYVGHKGATQQVLKNNWLCTGDYGKKDEQGFIYFCGLKKNMINVAGTNVYPRYVERMMRMCANVDEVTLFGEPSVCHGHTLGVRVVLHDNSPTGQEKTKKWCLRHLNARWIPKTWIFDE
jgi:long-chain acyl-CoA synthetase